MEKESEIAAQRRRRAEKNEQKKAKRAAETPEQREERLAKRRRQEAERRARPSQQQQQDELSSNQPSHAAAHPDYAPNLLNEPAPDLRVLMCIRRALQREPPEAIGSSSEMEAAGQENSSSSLSCVHKLARKFEKDQAEVAKAVVSQTQPSAALQPHDSGAQGSSKETEAASQDSSSPLDELARRLEEDHTEEAEAGAEDADQPTKEDPSAEPQVSPETLRHVKDNLQRHLLKLKKKRKKQ